MYRKIKEHKTTQPARFVQIARLNQDIFQTQDLANLWQIKQANTLYTTLKRYTQKKLLYRLSKGLYSIKPMNELDPQELGLKALRAYGYVSCEMILAQDGIMQQVLPFITLVSDRSRRFAIGQHQYRVRQLQDKYLFQSAGLAPEARFKTASLERAVADLLYFNPRAYLDGARQIDWPQVKKLQQKIGFPLTPHYYDFAKT